MNPPSLPSPSAHTPPPRRGRFSWVPWVIAGLSAVVAVASFGANASYFQKAGQVEERWHSPLSLPLPPRL
jgi:hypothetical protein